MTEQAASVETKEDIGTAPTDVYKRWSMEVKLAEKQRKDWVAEVKDVIEIYSSKKKRPNAFNIVWANTETLRPSIYNSLPRPDVRRRFGVDDDVGETASEMIERALTYSLDCYGIDGVFRMSALDLVLTGRGIARVRYVPAFTGAEESQADDATEGQAEELASEQCTVEHVQWDDFLHGPGKIWGAVPWVAFRHRMTRDQLREKFGEVGDLVAMDSVDDDDLKKMDDTTLANTFKTAEVWEIWDKDSKSVVFISEGYKDGPLLTVADPLSLVGFFPVPEPVYAVERSDSLIPCTPYGMYKEQAEELTLISNRIAVITKALKLRGVYDATVTEMGDLLSAGDNTLIPVQNLSVFLEKGGVEKAIWMMPVEQAAKVLAILEGQREACKQVIYEITGISDIVRGSSNAQETATAQQIKAQFGTVRLQRMQREFQRYIRDIVRMMAEVIGERFQPESLMQMTSMPLPTEQMAQAQMVQAQMQYAMAAEQAVMAGQQPPPPPKMEKPVTIEAVKSVLENDLQRQYRIDIETDSTIQAMEGLDQQAISNLLTGIGGFVQSVAPGVQAGLIPAEAAKALLSSIIRKYKLGREVDDAFQVEADTGGQDVAMAQVQQAAQEVEAEAWKVEQSKKELAYQEKLAKAEIENDRLKVEHMAEVHKVRTEQAQSDILTEVRRMLDEHRLNMRVGMQ